MKDILRQIKEHNGRLEMAGSKPADEKQNMVAPDRSRRSFLKKSALGGIALGG